MTLTALSFVAGGNFNFTNIPKIYERQKTAWFYSDRTAGRHRYHRDPGSDASTCAVEGQGEGDANRLLE